MNNQPIQMFEELISCLQKMPYADRSFHKGNGEPSESIIKFSKYA